MFENRSNGSLKIPIHLHANDDESLYMLQGEMLVVIARNEHSVEAGGSIFMPRGIPHELMKMSGALAHNLYSAHQMDLKISSRREAI